MTLFPELSLPAEDEDVDGEIQRAFEAWLNTDHGKWVYAGFVREALLEREHSRRSVYGASAIVEKLRWNYRREGGKSQFKIPARYVSRITRKAMKENPPLQGFFRITQLRS